MLAAAVQFCITPVYGAVSDRIGRRPVYMFGAAFLVLFAFPFFWLLQSEKTALVWIAFVLAYAVGNGAMFATQPAFFSELFGSKVRYSGVSLGYQLAAVFAGGLAPFIAQALFTAAGSYWPVALQIVVVGRDQPRLDDPRHGDLRARPRAAQAAPAAAPRHRARGRLSGALRPAHRAAARCSTPAAGLAGRLDVAVAGGRVAAVGPRHPGRVRPRGDRRERAARHARARRPPHPRLSRRDLLGHRRRRAWPGGRGRRRGSTSAPPAPTRSRASASGSPSRPACASARC